MAIFDLKNAVMKIKGGGASDKITVKLGGGNLTYDEKRNIEYIKDRGKLDAVRLGDEEPVEVKFDAQWINITSDGDPVTIDDALNQTGGAEDWASSDADPCNPYAVDIIIEYTPLCDDDDPETITLADFRYESLSHDAKNGTISCSGKCNVTRASATRGAIAS